MRVKVLKVIQGSSIFLTFEVRQTQVTDGAFAHTLKPGLNYDLVKIQPRVMQPPQAPMSARPRGSMDIFSNGELLDELHRRLDVR